MCFENIFEKYKNTSIEYTRKNDSAYAFVKESFLKNTIPEDYKIMFSYGPVKSYCNKSEEYDCILSIYDKNNDYISIVLDSVKEISIINVFRDERDKFCSKEIQTEIIMSTIDNIDQNRFRAEIFDDHINIFDKILLKEKIFYTDDKKLFT